MDEGYPLYDETLPSGGRRELLSNISELDDDLEEDASDDDDDDPKRSNKLSTSYSKNWGAGFDEFSTSHISDSNLNDLSEKGIKENFILKERNRNQNARIEDEDAQSQTTAIDNEDETTPPRPKPPVPTKRINIRRALDQGAYVLPASVENQPSTDTVRTVDTWVTDRESTFSSSWADDEENLSSGSISGVMANGQFDIKPPTKKLKQRPRIPTLPQNHTRAPPIGVDKKHGAGFMASTNPTLAGLGQGPAFVPDLYRETSEIVTKLPGDSVYSNPNYEDVKPSGVDKVLPEISEHGAHDNPAFEPDDSAPKPRKLGERAKAFAKIYKTSFDLSADKDPEKNKSKEISDHDLLDWDVFRSFQYDTELYACEGLYKVITKVLKVLFILISFLLILACLVASKLSLLFAASNMNPDIGFRKQYGECVADDYAGKCSRGIIESNTANFDNQCGVPVKYDVDGCKRRDVIRWMWCVLLCLCVPYVFTFLSSVWKICFKKKKKPTCRAVAMVMFTEALHTAGVMILAFMVLPGMDIFRGIFLMNATGFFPSCFKLFIRPSYLQKRKGLSIFADILSFILQLAPLAIYVGLAAYSMTQYDNSSSPYGCSAEDKLVSKGVNCTLGGSIWEPPVINPNNSANQPNYQFSVNVTRCGPGAETLSDPKVYLIPVALLLISITWWQNYAVDTKKVHHKGDRRTLDAEIRMGKTKIYAIVSIWKIILSFAIFLIMGRFYLINDNQDHFKDLFGLGDAFTKSSPFHTYKVMDNDRTKFENDWLIVFGVNAVAGFLCYQVTVNAIQARVQQMTFSLAIACATPVAFIFALFGFCWDCTPGNTSIANGFNLNDLYWNCFDGFNNFRTLIVSRPLVMLGVAWWIGQLILGRHLWTPKVERLAKAGRIFMAPYYCGALLEQSMTFNRSRNDHFKQKAGKLPHYKDEITPDIQKHLNRQETTRHNAGKKGAASRVHAYQEDDDDDDFAFNMIPSGMEEPLYDRPDRTTPMIFICATMWHENEQEMVQMIKSVIRLDKDQCTRRLAKSYFKIKVPDYYDFEGHIFFDDAFEKYVPGDPVYKVNRFVSLFVKIINQAATFVHKAEVEIEPPKKIPTPYGGKMCYVLPGGNKLILHLKDKQKIRHRKRWSQVMYMYYLLGHRLWNKPISRKAKEEVAYNTYMLALDGDVDFKPEAVLLLVDLMRRNNGVGAACGRIHPAGNGPMVWYQKFEYAISHWLQKSTEHVLGCVLCSPGCFSLFRASSIMDDNIMHTYSKTAEEAIHYVQYDQGEDRWLCTLLLQRGYRVEYSAASDAMTYAPEGFNEFFNQRRRWSPSTFANIIDLLSTGRETASRNENISIMYIVYQGGLLVSSILGPGTIFLMTVGAFSSVFTTMSQTGAFFLVFTPIAVFFILCFLAKSGIQLAFAALLGGLFAICQMVVLVGVIVGIVNDGMCGPTTWFLLMTTGIFVISAILHPQEFFCILHGLLYFLAIPTMYLLLIIYSLCNLNVVSWGTREVIQTQAETDKLKQRELELAAGKVVAAAAPTAATPAAAAQAGVAAGLLGMFGLGGGKGAGAEDGWSLSCGDCCRCMCCPKPGESYTDKKISSLQKQLLVLTGHINKLVSDKDDQQSVAHSESSESESEGEDVLKPLLTNEKEEALQGLGLKPILEDKISDKDEDDDQSSNKSEEVPIPVESEPEHDEKRPYWAQNRDTVGNGPIGEISESENDFWKHLIKRYLQPIDANPEREERIKKELKGLRNKAVIAFFMINVLFIVLIQTLQTIPIGGGTPGSSNPNSTTGYYLRFTCNDPVTGEKKEQEIEPIGFAFLIIFGIFLVIQFFGMLFHRLFSLIQIVSTTILCGKKQSEGNMDYVKFTQQLAALDSGDDTPETASIAETDILSDNEHPSSHHLQPVGGNVIQRLQSKRKVYKTMDKTFAQRFLALQNVVPEEEESIREPPVQPGVRQRLFSLFGRQRSNTNQSFSGALPPRPGMFRKKSVHHNAVADILRRRSTLFAPERTQQIRERFNPSDRELRHARSKVNQLVRGDTKDLPEPDYSDMSEGEDDSLLNENQTQPMGNSDQDIRNITEF